LRAGGEVAAITADIFSVVAHALDISHDMLAVLERDTRTGELRILHCNGAFCRAFRAQPGEIEGRAMTALVDPEQTAKRALLAGAAAHGESLRTEMRCLRPDGSRFWFGLHLMPAEDAERRNLFVLLGRDITARKLESERQDAVQSLLAKVFTVVNTGVAIVTGEGRFMMTNPYLDRLLGHEPGTLTGRASVEQIATESRAAVEHARERQSVDHKPYTMEVALLAADGARIQAVLASSLVARADLERFRILTVSATERPAIPGLPVRMQVAGKIRMIALEEVKAALGDRWDGLVERVMATAERVLTNRLAKTDSFHRTVDHAFVVCFAEMSEEEATFHAAAIGREIRARLIGQGEEPAAVEVSAVVATVTAARADVAADHADLAAQMAQIESHALNEASNPVAVPHLVLEDVVARDAGPVVGHYIRRIAPPRPPRGGGIVALSPTRFDLDLHTWQSAVRLAVAQHSERVEPYFVDLAFDCFFSRQKTEGLIEACRAADPAARERIIVMLDDLPADVASARVLDAVQRLKPFCRHVGFALDAPELPPTEVAATVGTFVAVDASRWDHGNALSEPKVARLGAALHSRKSWLMMQGVTSPRTRDFLRGCGVNFFSVGTAQG
jgi:PAS domain S-box-containing protein